MTISLVSDITLKSSQVVCDWQTQYNTLISEQPYIHARWSIFTFPGQNEPRPGHETPWVNSWTIPAIPGWLATLNRYHYDLRKFSFAPRIVNVWNSLPEIVISAADWLTIIRATQEIIRTIWQMIRTIVRMVFARIIWNSISSCYQNLSSHDLKVLIVSDNTTWSGRRFQALTTLLVK